MSSPRNKKIDEVFTGALERSGQTREAFLHEHCDGDNDLLQEVQSLLDAAEATDDGLDGQLSGIRDRLLRSVFEGDPETGEVVPALSRLTQASSVHAP